MAARWPKAVWHADPRDKTVARARAQTRRGRECGRSASVAKASSRASESARVSARARVSINDDDDGTVTTRGGDEEGGLPPSSWNPRRRLPGGRRVCSAARAQRERSASAARARPCGAARRGASVVQPDAARLDAAHRARSPQMPKKQNAKGAAECRKNKKNVFRDGTAGGFEPAPLNRRCPPETTSPIQEAGAFRSGERPHKQRSDTRRRAQGKRGAEAGSAPSEVDLARVMQGRR